MATPNEQLTAILSRRKARAEDSSLGVLDLARPRVVPEVNKFAPADGSLPLAEKAPEPVEPPLPTIAAAPTVTAAPVMASDEARSIGSLDISFTAAFSGTANLSAGASTRDVTIPIVKIEQYTPGWLGKLRSWDVATGSPQKQSLSIVDAAPAPSTSAATGGGGGAALGHRPSFKVVKANVPPVTYTWQPGDIDIAAYGLNAANTFVLSTLRPQTRGSGSSGACGSGTSIQGRVEVVYRTTGLAADTNYAFQVVPGLLTIKAGNKPALKPAPSAGDDATSATTTGTAAPPGGGSAPSSPSNKDTFTIVWAAPSPTSDNIPTLSAAEQAKREAAAKEAADKALKEAEERMAADVRKKAAEAGVRGRIGHFEALGGASGGPKKPIAPPASLSTATSAALAAKPSGLKTSASPAASTASAASASTAKPEMGRAQLEEAMARITELEARLKATEATAKSAQEAKDAADAKARDAATAAAAAGASAEAAAAAESARVEAAFAAERATQATEAVDAQTAEVNEFRDTVTRVLADAAASAQPEGSGAGTTSGAASGEAGAAGSGSAASSSSGGGLWSYIGSFVRLT